MAKKVVVKTVCDVCNKETETKKYPILVRFLTEQTEGTYVEPYYQIQHLDLCEDCLKELVVIEGTGLQGYNEYRVKK